MTDRPPDGEPPEELVDADLPGMGSKSDAVEPDRYVPEHTAEDVFQEWLDESTNPMGQIQDWETLPEDIDPPPTDPPQTADPPPDAIEAPAEWLEPPEPIQDHPIREAFTDEIDRSKLPPSDPGLSHDEALELLDEAIDEEAESRARQELEKSLEEGASEPPEWIPPDPDPTPYLPRPRPTRQRPWLRWFAVGAFGGLGLIVLRLTVFGDAAPATTTLAAVPSTTEAIVLETTPTEPVASTTPPDSSTTSVTPALDPADRVTIVDFEGVADAAGDLWVILTFQSPWVDGSPASDFAFTALVGAGVEVNGRFHSSLWSVSNGTSYAEGTDGASAFPRTSREEPIVQAAMWISPDGRLAIRIPGSSPNGGLDAGLVTPDTPLILLSSLVAAEGAAPMADNQDTVLGEITDGDDYPQADWVELEPDSEPIVLNIPSG